MPLPFPRLVALVVFVAAAACSPAPPVREAQSGAPSATAAPSVTAAPSASAARAAVEPLDAQELARRVSEAYEMRARGESKEASAVFREVLALLAAAGEEAAKGLGRGDGEVVRGHTLAALSMPGGAWFFDVATGEPSSFVPGLSLRPGAPALDGSVFATVEGEGLKGLHDAAGSRPVELPGSLIALHPDGHRVYLLGDDCRLREWSLQRAAVTAGLAPHTRPGKSAECDRYDFRDAAVTPDGKWLTTRFGRWDLGTRAHRPLPFRWSRSEYAPAVSPDGRYVARVRVDPKTPKDGVPSATVLVLYDLETGTERTAPEPMGVLSNGDPLSFASPPMRVCVFDYSFSAFEVPRLRRYRPGDPALLPGLDPMRFGPSSCRSWFVPPPPAHADLSARLASRVCRAGAFLFPIVDCPSPK